MKKVVFCEIAWMKHYCGINEDDKPINGGKYIAENQDGGEIYNFIPYNHKCYGYVMHYGDELHIERYDKILKSFDEVKDMTVVWVAADSNSKNCKIVGWYEHAVMYRHWHSLYDAAWYGERPVDYNFMADTKDCYLIPEENRTFVVPRAPKAGKGRGMGQSQVWYADSNYAQEEFIPKVMEYIDSAREEFKSMDFFYDGILEKAEDHGESTEALIDKCREILQDEKREWMEAFRFANLAVEKDDCYKTRFLRAQLYRYIAAYDEAEEEYKNALYHEETIEALADLMFVEILLNHTFLAIELGEKIRKRKSEDDYWTDNANNLAFLYIDEGEFDEARLLIEECEGEEDIKHTWTDKARKYLKEQTEAAKCVE